MIDYSQYPFTPRQLSVGPHRLHYVDQGPKNTDPIVMLHGNPTWSYLFRHQIGALQSNYRCLALDQLGFGFSDKPAGNCYQLAAHIDRFDAFINLLALDRVTLVVHDWGGVIGLAWAAQNKSKVSRLVILNSAAFVPDSLLQRSRPYLLWALKMPVVGELFVQGMNGMVRTLLTDPAYATPCPTWDSRRAQLAMVRQLATSPAHPTWRLLRNTGEALTGWDVPTQLIWGMKDPLLTPWFLAQFERRLPNHRPSIRLDQAGHFVPEDAPSEVTKALQSFLKKS